MTPRKDNIKHFSTGRSVFTVKVYDWTIGPNTSINQVLSKSCALQEQIEANASAILGVMGLDIRTEELQDIEPSQTVVF